jgi:YfiH family protein
MIARKQPLNPESHLRSNGGFRLEESANGWRIGRFAALETLGVPHLVTTRQGPDVARVRHETSLAGREIAQLLELDDAAFLEQVHGGEVLVCDAAGCAGRADGLVTTSRSLALLGKSGDCPIVLIADRRHQAVGFAHASWRATVARIVPNVVRTMVESGCAAGDLVACICPSAGPECYEVGEEVRAAAIEGIGCHAASFFHPGPGGKDHFDLWAANADALIRTGVPSSSIHAAGVCTMCHNGVFPSHRREGESAGRFAAAIGLWPSRQRD